MRVTIIGVKKSDYKGKDGQLKKGFNICGTKEFTRYELENAECEGKDVVREWTNIDFNVHSGDEVEFIYEPGFQEKATLVDIKVLSFGNNPFPEKKEETPDKAAADPKEKTKTGAGA